MQKNLTISQQAKTLASDGIPQLGRIVTIFQVINFKLHQNSSIKSQAKFTIHIELIM
ncbi:unnamed protein product, partial [Larinioides sclopetarius]